MINKRGSALLMVLIAAAVVSILGISLLTVTQSGAVMSEYNLKSTSAYYIAESGIERAASVIKYDIGKIAENVRKNTLAKYQSGKLSSPNTVENLRNSIDSGIKRAIWSYIVEWGQDSFHERFSEYTGRAGKDSYILSAATGTVSYYKVTASVQELNDEDSVTSIRIGLQSTGYAGSAIREITAEYRVSYPTDIIESSGTYESLHEYLNNSLSVINKGSTLFEGCSIDAYNDILIESPSVQFKNCSICTGRENIIKSSSIEMFNNVNLKGIMEVDYDNLSFGADSLVNEVKSRVIPDSCIQNFEFIPASLPVNTASGCGVKYIIYNDSSVLDKPAIEQNPGAIYCIIAMKDLEIKSALNEDFGFNGVIYCDGVLKINCGRFILNGAVICKSSGFKGNININDGILTQGQLDEIESRIKSSIQSGAAVNGEYVFKCVGWKE